MQHKENLVWIDLEMTGLDPECHCIIEIATIITDSDLNVLAEGPVVAIHQSEAALSLMDDWNVQTHGNSGLTARVRTSEIDTSVAEQMTLDFIQQYVPRGVAPLCGNSIWQDRRFLGKHMPQLEAYFHYRVIDVSTIKELAKRWHPTVYNGIEKAGAHTALADIRESIAEMQYYREHLFRRS